MSLSAKKLAPLLVAACLAIGLGLGGCGGSSTSSTQATGTATGAAAATASGPGTPGSTPSSSSAGGDDSIQTYGSAASGAEKAAVLAAMHSFLGALAGPDYAAVCSDLSGPERRGLEQYSKLGSSKKGGCAAILPRLLSTGTSAARKAAKGTVTAVRIGGQHAFVLFRPLGGAPSYLVMSKEGSAWKPTGLAPGVPLDP